MSSFSLADLCDLGDVTPRTVRYYVAQGLLRPPTGAGPAARYDDAHLYRLRLIRRLQRDHLPLAEIRRRLAALSDGDVERLVSEPPPVTDSAADYVARVLGSRGIGPSAKPGTTPATGAPADQDAAPPAPLPLGPNGLPTPMFLLARAGLVAPEPSRALEPTGEPIRSQWERISLCPEVELHVRRPLSRDLNRRVDRLLETARTIFKEDDR